MAAHGNTRREFLRMAGIGMTLGARAWADDSSGSREPTIDEGSFVRPEELTLKFEHGGTLGSFSVVFSRCYNAPAHCIPGVLAWMDRSDIAGMNAPRPIRLHYGQGDVIADWNNSASYNETVEPALAELKTIYKAFGAEDQITLRVTPNALHEMELPDLQTFLAG